MAAHNSLPRYNWRIRRLSWLIVLALVSACGDNGGGTDASRVVYPVDISVAPAPLANGLQLQLNGSLTTTVPAATNSATFSTGLTDGQAWTVTLTGSPSGEHCRITGPGTSPDGTQATGTVQSGPVNIPVDCTQITYALSGTFTGDPVGKGLTLQDFDSGVAINVAAGAKQFTIQPPTLYANGQFDVAVASQPTMPTQVCTPSQNTGVVSASQQPPPQSRIVINCQTSMFPVSGSMAGYAGDNMVMTLSDMSTKQSWTAALDTKTGTFNFPAQGSSTPVSIASGDTITLQIQSPTNPTHTPGTGLTQACTTGTSTVTVTNQPVTFPVTCTTTPFSVYVAVSGLQPFNSSPLGYGLVLYDRLNNAKQLVPNDGVYNLETLLDGTGYSVTVGLPTTQGQDPTGKPRGLNCYVMNEGPLVNDVPQSGVLGSGTVAGADVNAIAVKCSPLSRFLYVTQPEGGTGDILGYAIEPQGHRMGFLAPIQPPNTSPPPAPAQTTGLPGPLSILPNSAANPSAFAYVANHLPATLTAYTIDNTTGWVTANGSSPVPTSTFNIWAQPLGFDAAGQNVFVSSYGNTQSTPELAGGVTEFPLAADGTLGTATFYPTGEGAWGQLVFAANPTSGQTFAYQANIVQGGVTAFSVGSGTLSLDGTPAPVSEAIEVRVDPTAHFAYVLSYSIPSYVYGYQISSSGVLNSMVNSPFTDAGITQVASPYSATAIDPSDTYLFVANGENHSISVFRIDPTTGAIDSSATGSPFSYQQGLNPVSISIDPSGKFAYVLYYDSCNIGAFSINLSPKAIALTPIGFYSTGGVSPAAPLVIDPSGAFLFVANTGSANIGAFVIDSNTGVLSPAIGSPFSAYSVTQTYLCGERKFPTGPGVPTILQ